MLYQYSHRLGAYAPGLDPDAKAYIAAVEAADGQALEPAVRVAYDQFIRGCKTDGIWDAIKASCILAGARTLSGALVPLKGTAPTNFNFVSGDYNRETGLIGDGASKYLNTNRNNNADPQNNQHISVYVSTVGSLIALSTESDPTTIQGATHIGLNFIHSRNDTSDARSMQTGFNGITRQLSTEFLYRISGVNQTFARGSQTPASANLYLMRSGTLYGSHRIPFYSIGESIDLAALDSRVSTLISDIAAAIP